MKFRTHLFIVVMLLLTAFSYAGTLPTYDVVELPFNVEDPQRVMPRAINNSHQIVGSDFNDFELGQKQFLYENGKIVNVDDIIGEHTYVLDINNAGQMTGTGSGGYWMYHEGNITRLPLMPWSINSKGQIAGVQTIDDNFHAAVWENGVLTNIDTLGSYNSYSIDINEKGQVVGNIETESGAKRAFLYENGVMRDLGIEGGVYDINEAGQILVYAKKPQGYIIALWEDGKIIDIGIKYQELYEQILFIGLNNMGQVFTLNGDFWSKESGLIRLSSLLPDNTYANFFCMNTNGELLCTVYSGERKFIGVLVQSTQQAVVPPLFSYESGIYNKPIEVKVTSPTENAVIHYTTNGVDPTESDPTIESGGTVLVDKDTVLKAKAWRSDCKPSGVRETEYKIRQKTWKGLAMVSVPAVPSSADPKLVVGFTNNYWYAYNPVTRSYAGYPDQYTWFDLSKDNSIRAFWAKFSTETPVPEGKYPFDDEYLRTSVGISLKPGWNMIGQPYISAIKWDTSIITVFATDYSKPLKDSGEYVYPYIWGWKTSVVNPNTGAYYRVGDPSVYPDAVDTMEPFEGYWIRAKKECRIVFYR